MPENSNVCINDTLKYISKSFALLKTTTEDYLQKSIGNILSIIQDPPKTLPFLSYGDATKNAINHIAHILQRSTAQPWLSILPLALILPQVQTQTPFPNLIICPDAPSPRVVTDLKPLRVQLSKPVPIAPLRVKDAPSTSIDTHTNPFIEVVYNSNNNTPSIKTKTKTDLPHQVQHRLHCTTLNVGTKFFSQAAQQLVVHHMFNLLYALRIYNKQGKK